MCTLWIQQLRICRRASTNCMRISPYWSKKFLRKLYNLRMKDEAITLAFHPAILVLVRSWTKLSFLPNPFCHVHIYGMVCGSQDFSLPRCSAPPLRRLGAYFWYSFELSLVMFKTRFLASLDCLSCVQNHFWSILASTGSVAWLLRSFWPP